LIVGAVLAVAAALALVISDALGWSLDAVVLVGAAAGGVLGLVADRGPVNRVLAFLVGILAGAIGYVLRAAVFPDNTNARALTAALVILVVALVAGVSASRLPLWAGLLGVGALAGAYEEAFTASPGSVLTTLPVWLTSVLVMAAVGFAASVFFGTRPEAEEYHPRRARGAEPGDGDVQEEDVHLDDVLARGSN
jgi:hypothetical protein